MKKRCCGNRQYGLSSRSMVYSRKRGFTIFMKKLILTILLLIGTVIVAEAQTYWYKTTSFAYRQVIGYGTWSNWTPWEPSDMYITIDLDRDLIKVYSPTTQIYFVQSYDTSYTDSSGGRQVQYTVIDQDRDVGRIRLRVERNGNSQIYVDFSNVMWVYNVKRIK